MGHLSQVTFLGSQTPGALLGPREDTTVSGTNVPAQSPSRTSSRMRGGRQTCGQAAGRHRPAAKPVGSGTTV